MKLLFILYCLLCTAPLSREVVRSEMERWPEASQLDWQQGKLKWNYTTGIELKAFLDVYDRYKDETVLKYVDDWYDSMIAQDGSIQTYKIGNYSTDHVCPARSLFRLYDLTGKEKYLRAMQLVRSQLDSQPRTPEGGFWHKKAYPDQMWLDGLYMAQPFYAEYTARFEPEERRDSIYADIVRHFLIAASHCYDPATGLYRHAWDSSRQMFWCDAQTGQSAHAWGRALGWYCMAVVETLPFIPEETPGRNELLDVLRGIYDTLPLYADPGSGMWYQVLDRPGDEGNYTEASCSAMFTYAWLKGKRLGYLDGNPRRAYRRLLKEFVRKDGQGCVELVRCCEVAGLGGKQNRSGDYSYYVNEKIRSNDPKGIAPLIWAALEMERK